MANHVFNRRGILGAMAIAPVVVAAPAVAAIGPSHFETLRLEYVHIQKTANAGYDDEDPAFLALCDRLSAIERKMQQDKCSNLADAKAKMRFMLDLNQFGTVLDGDDAHEMIEDMSRFML